MGSRDFEGERRRLPDSYLHGARWRPQAVPLIIFRQYGGSTWSSMDDLPDVEKTFDFTDALFDLFHGQP